MRKFLALLAAFGVAASPLSASAQQLSTVDIDASQLRLATSAANSSGETKTYVVQLRDKPALSYDGGHLNYAATAPANGQRYDAYASHVRMYVAHLQDKQNAKLQAIGAAGRKMYSYTHTMNGFAAQLTEQEAELLRGDKNVVGVWEDFAFELDTNNSPEFLGLDDRRSGLHRRLRLKGEDVIVGILDTGITVNHPSFSDTRTFPLPRFCDHPGSRVLERICDKIARYQTQVVYDAPPAHWSGACEVGEGFTEADCNNKLIGARWYVDGFLAGRGSVVEGEFLSPRDSSGHGSHTASTAAGNKVIASLNGTDLAKIKGMAPRARVAAYKVCWLSPGATNFSCFFSDSAAATEQAVMDGVDVLNFSVGTASSFVDPQDLAFLDAASAGVFIARSAGNSGPGFATTPAGEPWVTTVGASTLSGTGFALAAAINSPPSVAGDYAALEGAITQPLTESGDVTDDVTAADPVDACVPLANTIDGIALIARGTCAFTTKVENAVAAGASAVLMYTDSRPKTVMGGTATPITLSIPGVMIDNADGLALLDELTAGNTVNGTLSAGNFTTEALEGNIMAGFSSRGPYLVESDWLKPDITAPGVRILAAYSPDQADGSAGDIFSYLQGTSMSSPHIAGLAALVIQAQPDWSPAQVKSALMTTARQDVVKEDGATAGDPFDFGAGHVDPNKAVDPGLTYDAGLIDYLAASCGTVSPLISPSDCDFVESVLGFSTDPADLNLPSIAIGQLPGSQTVTRTVTAVRGYKGPHGFYGSNRSRTYHAVVDAPEGYNVEVSPSYLRLRPGESATYEVTITNETAPPGEWFFGSLTWTDHKDHNVRSPIAVNGVAIIAPAERINEGPDGSDEFDITFGYTGDYSAGTHGLNDPSLSLSVVEDDPGNSFQFLGPGTAIAFLAEVPP
ncbi:MAG: S8 family serine peptidase, partial [Woeseiaceae bacterium]|nr:S8 family serine peptidase [Woeseiaceae bacterium]